MKIFPRLLILTLLVAPMFALAQPATRPSDGRPSDGRPGRGAGGGDRPRALLDRVEVMLGDLKLSDRQRDTINGIIENARGEIREIIKQTQMMEPPERQQKIREFIQGVQNSITAELDDEQKAEFVKKSREFRQTQGQGSGQGQGPGNGQRQGGGVAMLERFQTALKALELTDDQKNQVETILADVRKQFQELREKAQNGGDAQEVREQGRQILADVREKLQGILTPEQQAKFRESMQPPADGQRNNSGDRQRKDDKPDAPKDMMEPKPDATPKADTPKAEAVPPPPTTPIVQVGSAAPDFNLQKLDGKTLQLSSFKGRPIVLIFGSASSPSFRDRSQAIQELFRDLGGKAAFLIVYTREAHAKDEWEVDRNKDDKILIPQHAGLEDRLKLAKQTREGLKFTVPFAVDSMDNATLTAYGAEENSAFIIAKDGTIAVSQKWCDPYRLRTAIETAVSASPTTQK